MSDDVPRQSLYMRDARDKITNKTTCTVHACGGAIVEQLKCCVDVRHELQILFTLSLLHIHDIWLLIVKCTQVQLAGANLGCAASKSAAHPKFARVPELYSKVAIQRARCMLKHNSVILSVR